MDALFRVVPTFVTMLALTLIQEPTMKKTIDAMLYASALCLVAGAFLPFTHFAVIGNISYYQMASLETYVLIAFAISAPLFNFLKWPKLLWLSLIGVWATALFPIVRTVLNISQNSIYQQLPASIARKLNENATQWLLDFGNYRWGGYIFLLGLMLLTLGVILRRSK